LSWVNEDGPKKFLKELYRQRDAQVEVILGLCNSTQDPAIRMAIGALEQLSRTIRELEDERGDE